jgi:hypothetical protein
VVAISAESRRRPACARPRWGAEEVEVAPAHGADEAHAPAVGAVMDQRFALQQRMPRLAAQGPQAGPGLVEVAAVEFVVAGHQQHRHRPAGKTRQPAQVLSMSPASTSSSAPGAGSGSKASVSRCRSDSSCSFMARACAALPGRRGCRGVRRARALDARLGRRQFGRQVVASC